MLTTRRRFIRVMGSGALIAAAVPTLSACDPIPSSATAAWREPGVGESDPRRWALAHALLAPNPHNMQPWLVDLGTPDVIDLYIDTARLLPQTDPFSRQIVIGHGTFLELLAMAAAERGFRAEVAYLPVGDLPPDDLGAKPLARVRFVAAPTEPRDPLFAAIPQRRSNKEPFDAARPLHPEDAAALAGLSMPPGLSVAVSSDDGLVADLRQITMDAFELEMRTPRTLKESVDVIRIGGKEIDRYRDGIDLSGTMIDLGKFVGVVSHETIQDPTSRAFKMNLDFYRDITGTAVGYLWLVSETNDRATQLTVGRQYVRANLLATSRGVSIHPLSQVLQEYPEMADLQRRFLERLSIEPGQTVQMLARLGYGETPAPSPRRDLGDMIRA